MIATDEVARRKLSLLELANDLDDVSKACKLMGYSRQQSCEIQRNFQTHTRPRPRKTSASLITPYFMDDECKVPGIQHTLIMPPDQPAVGTSPQSAPAHWRCQPHVPSRTFIVRSGTIPFDQPGFAMPMARLWPDAD